MAKFADLDKKYGLQAGTIASIFQQETSSGQNVKTSSAGAKGYMQFMPGTRNEVLRETGLDAYSSNVQEAADAAGYYLNKLGRVLGTKDTAVISAAYNAGAGNVKRAMAKGGGNWLAHMPAETRKYVPSVLGRLGISVDEVDAANDDTSRRSLLERIGFDEKQLGQLSPSDMIGQLFFMLIAQAISSIMEGKSVRDIDVGATRKSLETETSKQASAAPTAFARGVTVDTVSPPPPTPAVPKLAAAGRVAEHA